MDALRRDEDGKLFEDGGNVDLKGFNDIHFRVVKQGKICRGKQWVCGVFAWIYLRTCVYTKKLQTARQLHPCVQKLIGTGTSQNTCSKCLMYANLKIGDTPNPYFGIPIFVAKIIDFRAYKFDLNTHMSYGFCTVLLELELRYFCDLRTKLTGKVIITDVIGASLAIFWPFVNSHKSHLISREG